MSENSKHLSIKALAEDDRPREKLTKLGRNNLTDAEIIAIILGSGNYNETAVQLAQRLLSDHQNNLNVLAKATLHDLKKYRGIGAVKAVNLLAAFEIGRRRGDGPEMQKEKITSSRSAFKLFAPKLSDLPHEEFWIILLDRANQVIKEANLSKGGIAGTVVDIRLICKTAIDHAASGAIIAHNHPSGQIIPSEQDKQITKKLKESFNLLEISLLDHIIIGEGNYFSFADEGLL